ERLCAEGQRRLPRRLRRIRPALPPRIHRSLHEGAGRTEAASGLSGRQSQHRVDQRDAERAGAAGLPGRMDGGAARRQAVDQRALVRRNQRQCGQRGVGMKMRTLAIVIAMLATTATARAAEIDAFISTALKTVTDELVPPFERANNVTVRA